MTAQQLLSASRCAGKPDGDLLHKQCQNCQRLTVPGGPRIAHFLPPKFVAGKCPMRVQA